MSGGVSHRIEYHWTRPLSVRYLGPTAGGKGARYVVRDDSDGRRVVVSDDDAATLVEISERWRGVRL